MHEFSLMENIVSLAEKSAADNGIAKITSLHLIVGALSGANADALRFAFEIHQRAGDLPGASLVIETEAGQGNCRDCGSGFEARDYWPVCPGCGSLSVAVSGGDGLRLDSIEGD